MSRISAALSSTPFQGDLIYAGDGGSWQSIRIGQSVHNGGVLRLTDYLSGARRSQIRHKDSIICSHDGPHIAGMVPDVFQPFDQRLPERLASISSNYQISQSDDTYRIAGHITHLVSFVPRTSDRYSYQLWLDADTDLILRSDLNSPEGDTLQRFQFASVEIGDNAPISEMNSDIVGHTIAVSAPSGKASYPESGWWPGWLPSGYLLERYVDAHSADDGVHQRMLFSDGLSSFTVFVDEVGAGRFPEMNQRWSATSAAVRHLNVEDSGFRITVVGEMPAATISRIAESVRPSEHIAHQ